MKYTTSGKALVLVLTMYVFACIVPGSYGQAPTPSFSSMPDFKISDSELNSLVSYLESLDDKKLEELEQLTKKTLADMGIDYETLAPLPQVPEKPIELPVEEKKPESPATKSEMAAVSPMLINRAKEIIKNLIDAIEELRTKAATTLSYDATLNRWLPDLNRIAYYLRVVNKEVHYKRLSDPKFESLFQGLEKLNKAIRTYSPTLSAPITRPDSYEDPYEILSVSPSATNEEIENTYQELSNFQSPKLIQERLTLQGRSQAEIEKAVQEASISFDFITDAYEKLKDPKSRRLIDRELQAYYAAERTTSRSLENAREALAASIGDAVFKDQVINKLEQFLKEYEPAELQQRQQMEKAEAQRAAEAKEIAIHKGYDTGKTQIVKTRPTRLPWEGLDFLNPTPPPSSPKAPAQPKEITPTPEKGAASEAKKPTPKGGGGKGGKKEEKKDKDKGEDKDKDKEKKEDKDEKGKKKDEKKDKDKDKDKKKEELFDVLALQILELDESLSRFNQKFDRDFFLQAQIKQTPIEKLAPDLQTFSKASNLEEINKKLESLLKSLEKAEERKLKQYKTLWKEIEKTVKAFKANLALADQTGRTYVMPEELMPKTGPVKDAVTAIKLFGKTIDNLTKVDTFINEAKAKAQKQDEQKKEGKEEKKPSFLDQMRGMQKTS